MRTYETPKIKRPREPCHTPHHNYSQLVRHIRHSPFQGKPANGAQMKATGVRLKRTKTTNFWRHANVDLRRAAGTMRTLGTGGATIDGEGRRGALANGGSGETGGVTPGHSVPGPMTFSPSLDQKPHSFFQSTEQTLAVGELWLK